MISIVVPVYNAAPYIENTVQMNVVGVGMDCKEILILALEKSLA